MGGLVVFGEFEVEVAGFFLAGLVGDVLVLPVPLQGLVFFFLHLLEEFLIIGETFVLDDLPDLAFDSASDHAVDGILLALDVFLGLPLLVLAGLMYFGVEGQFFN